MQFEYNINHFIWRFSGIGRGGITGGTSDVLIVFKLLLWVFSYGIRLPLAKDRVILTTFLSYQQRKFRSLYFRVTELSKSLQ